MSFCLLVPVKRLSRSKSRLGSPAADRAALMRAFAGDALAVARRSRAVSEVYVVSDEDVWSCPTLPDLGDGDLNAAVRHAERAVRLAHPDRAVAVMCADLPALTTADLDTALDLSLAGALGPRWFVADADGTGTTLLAAGPGVDLDPHFGTGSARRHEESGARPLRAPVPTLRLDVDTGAALRAAQDLGVGPLTAAELAG